jgi:hypothetical protein
MGLYREEYIEKNGCPQCMLVIDVSYNLCSVRRLPAANDSVGSATVAAPLREASLSKELRHAPALLNNVLHGVTADQLALVRSIAT